MTRSSFTEEDTALTEVKKQAYITTSNYLIIYIVLRSIVKYFYPRRRAFFGSIATFVGGVLLVISFASPYWLQSWEDTQSPFRNMGLWEFCFFKFRHPDYQFDHLFHGCHALYGEEYRLIREKLLPGWLMVVQLFVTVALITSFLGQLTAICLLIRSPLEWILRFEYPITAISLGINCFASALLFISVCVFGAECWDRDWLLYPNYNYVSWSYACALAANLAHIVASYFMFLESRAAKERKQVNKNLLMKLRPNLYVSPYAFSSGSFRSIAHGSSGYL